MLLREHEFEALGDVLHNMVATDGHIAALLVDPRLVDAMDAGHE